MDSLTRPSSRYILFCFLASLLIFGAANVKAQGQVPTDQAKTAKLENPPAAATTPKPLECSLSKTNKSCWLIIDRAKPVAPSTVQMYSGERVTVVVKQANTFERYFLDYQSGQATLTPDVASSIVQGLLPSLLKAGEIKSNAIFQNEKPPDVCANIASLPQLTPGQGKDLLRIVQICLGQLAAKAIDIYRKLEPLVAPDSLTPINPENPEPCALKACISAFEDSENAFSVKITAITSDPNLKDPNTKQWKYDADGLAINEILTLQKIADNVATDLQGYSRRLDDLPTTTAELSRNGFQNCRNVIPVPEEKPEEKHPMQCVVIESRTDNPSVYHNMVTRTITYSLNTYNLVSYPQEAAPDPTKKKLLATVALNFADTPARSVRSAFRWEASAGAFFSTLPIRSFAVVPVFTNGVITNKMIGQNVLHPTVVPFAAGNYRLTNDLKLSRWKSNLYWTGAVGINPNTVSADFATGLSFAWRALMVSGLAHFGHDVRLTQGLQVGQSLGAGFNGAIPTETQWTTSFALGISVRVPALTGR
jgi:hypothetical protein